MRRLWFSLLLATVVVAPAQGAGWERAASDVRPGAFVGARVQLPLGHHASPSPRATLAIAPTASRISREGMVRTRIGEGLALSIGESKPSLTIAGFRADTALALRQQGASAPGKQLAISTAGWVAIGVGTVIVVGGVAFALWADAVNDGSE